MTNEDADEAISTALQDLDRAYGSAAKAIEAHPDASRAFQQSGELVEVLRKLYEASADIRAKAALRIAETENMSIAGLANHIGVSKARAAQLIRVAKAMEEDSPKS